MPQHISNPPGLEEFDLAPSGVEDMSQICPTGANDMTHDAWVLGKAWVVVDVQSPYVVQAKGSSK